MFNNQNHKKIKLFDQSDHEQKPAPKQNINENQFEQEQNNGSFRDYPLEQAVISFVEGMGFTHPTKIQAQSLKRVCKDGDMLCLSETGSGKTLSFILPILNYIAKNFTSNQELPEGLALILVPTRELCIQINDYLNKFSADEYANLRSVLLYGGIDSMKQILELAKKPSIVIGTPGRILYHLQNTKGFHMKNLKYLILDEADKLLNLDFQKQLNSIIEIIPKERNSYLYSATLTSKVEKLQRVSLKNAERLEVNPKYKTVSKLEQYFIFIPSKWKDSYLIYLLHKYKNSKTIIFMKTCLGAQRLYLLLNELKFKCDCIHGDFSQIQRQKALLNFKSSKCQILVATDLAARGIDIAEVKVVINFDLCSPKEYVHRVGRTARIGREGIAVSIVTQYDVEMFQNIEKKLGKEIQELKTEEEQALVFLQKLQLCNREVSKKMKRKYK